MSEKIILQDSRLEYRSDVLQRNIEAAKIKRCPVEHVTPSFKDTMLGHLCASCPNRAPSQAEAEMREALEELYDLTDPPPDKNCSCHLCPPCNDCVTYDGLRNAMERARTILARYPKGET